jgi:hypothetical protein
MRKSKPIVKPFLMSTSSFMYTPPFSELDAGVIPTMMHIDREREKERRGREKEMRKV